MIPITDVIPSRTRPGVTIALMAATIGASLLQRVLSPLDPDAGLAPARALLLNVVASLFIRDGIGLLLGGLLYLRVFGENVEDRLGHARFAALYTAAGAVATLAQLAMASPSGTVPQGASSAVAGVMGGYLALYPRSRVLTLVPFPPLVAEVPAVFFIGLWFAVRFLGGLTLPPTPAPFLPGGAAFWAEVAAFMAGAVLARWLQRHERARVEWWGP